MLNGLWYERPDVPVENKHLRVKKLYDAGQFPCQDRQRVKENRPGIIGIRTANAPEIREILVSAVGIYPRPVHPCKSDKGFEAPLFAAAAHSLITTNGHMPDFS